MIVSMMQPRFLPWVGHYNRQMMADIHVVLDHVQMDWSNDVTPQRTRLGGIDGLPRWLTVPIRKSGNHDTPIKDIQLAMTPDDTRKMVLGRIRSVYHDAPFFDESYMEQLSEMMFSGHSLVEAVCHPSEAFVRRQFILLSAKLVCSSALTESYATRGTELLVDVCLKLREAGYDITTYLSGPGGKNYLREELFNEHEIEVAYANYAQQSYPQHWNKGAFVPGLSILDTLFEVGRDQTREWIINV